MLEPRESSPSSVQSVTQWLEQRQAGDSAAEQQLWQRYFERLIRLAWHKLGDLPRRLADEEYVVLSAFHDFQVGSKRAASRSSMTAKICGTCW